MTEWTPAHGHTPARPDELVEDTPLPVYAFNAHPDYGMRVHKVDRAYGIVYFATCGELVYGLPDGVRPTSDVLLRCQRCLPDGIPTPSSEHDEPTGDGLVAEDKPDDVHEVRDDRDDVERASDAYKEGLRQAAERDGRKSDWAPPRRR